MSAKQTDNGLWLVVGNLLRDLSLAQWRNASLWARALLEKLAALQAGGKQ